MNTIDFIQQDISKTRQAQSRLPGLIGLILVLLSVGLGMGLREDLTGVFQVETLVPNIFIVLSLLSCLYLYRSTSYRRTLKVILPAVGVALFFSSYRILFSTHTTFYASGQIFWREAEKCISKGVFSAFLASLAVGWVLFRFSPTLSRASRILTGVIVGMVSISMLSFHCDSSSPSHVLIAHWGQAVVGVLFSLGFQTLLFRKRIKPLG